MLTSSEFTHLQKLSCLPFAPEKEGAFSRQIDSIIGFLQQLNDIPLDADIETVVDKNRQSLLPRVGERVYGDSASLLQNVHHDLVNNSIVIKSVVSE